MPLPTESLIEGVGVLLLSLVLGSVVGVWASKIPRKFKRTPKTPPPPPPPSRVVSLREPLPIELPLELPPPRPIEPPWNEGVSLGKCTSCQERIVAPSRRPLEVTCPRCGRSRLLT